MKIKNQEEFIHKILNDINSKINKEDSKKEIENYINENTESVDFKDAIIQIINENTNETSIDEILQNYFDSNSIDLGLSEEEVETIVERKINDTANNISNPFTTAYWKDTENDKIYLVKVVNGVLTVTEIYKSK